ARPGPAPRQGSRACFASEGTYPAEGLPAAGAAVIPCPAGGPFFVSRGGSILTSAEALRAHGPTWLTRCPYIGPVTCWHLAKNVGMDVVKPDRHLVRMAQASGARDPIYG